LKPERSLRLSLWLPIIASATLLALWSVLTWHQYQHLAKEQVTNSQQFVAHDLTSLQKALERSYANGQFLQAEQALVGRSHTAGYKALAILDTKGQVLHASNPDWVGQPIDRAISSFDPEHATLLVRDGLSSFSYDDEGQNILAYFPIFGVTQQSGSKAEVVGSIFLDFQHQENVTALIQEALLETLPLLLLLALAMAVFVGMLHIYVTRPAKHLVAAASALAAGEPCSISDVRGKGELAYISKTFNKMSSDLEEQRSKQELGEQRLRKSEGRLRQAQRIAKVGHYHLDIATDLWTSSAELDEIFGIEESFQRNVEGWISIIHPEDAKRLADYLENEVIGKHQPFDLEYRILDRRNGEEKWVHGLGRLEFDDNGQPTGMFGAIQDITIRKQNEQALTEATDIINRSPTVTFLRQNFPGWPIEFVSENVASLLGYTKKDFTDGKIVYRDLIHVNDCARVIDEVAGNIHGEQRQSFAHIPYRILTKSGEVKWVDDLTFMRRNGKGEITHYEGLVTDVTEREEQRRLTEFLARRAKVLLDIPPEAESRTEPEFLQHCLAIAENLTDSCISFVHFVNDDEQTIALATWSKRTISKFCQVIADSHYPVRSAGIWADALREHQPVIFNDYPSYEFKKGLPDGHAELQRLISLPVMDNGKVVMLIGVGNKETDYGDLDVQTLQLLANEIWRIVQRRRAEEERDLLLANTEERMKEVRAIYQMAKAIGSQKNLEGIFQAAVTLIPAAWCYPESACARLVFEGEEYCSQNFLETKWCQVENIVVSGEALGAVEVCYREEQPTRDEGPFLNEERALLISLTLSISRAIEHAQSMAARETAELQLRQVQKMEAVGQLTGGIAHDFNNILCIILGNVDLLEMDIDPNDSILPRVQTIGKSAQRAADLTKQLLGFSRRQATQVSVIDINEAVEGMRMLIERTLTPTIEIDHDFAMDLWNTEIDAADFEDALLNLVLNARDAMPSGGALTISTANTSLTAEDCLNKADIVPGDYIELRVRDTGEGIPYGLQEHVFEPFFTTKSQGKGTGLGLAMVYGFTQRSKGAITCSSEPGVGTAFTIFLPRSLVVAQEPSPSIASNETLPHGTETVLVVDDELDLVEVAKHSLESLGYRVITAMNGGQALLQLAAHEEIDLLFTDIVMPGGINGHQLVQQAMRTRPELRTLMTSGYAQDAIVSPSSSPAQMILHKPYSQEELAHQVRLTLDSPPTATFILPEQYGEFQSTPSIEWSPDLAIGVDALDEDHQVLLQLISHGRQLLEVEDSGAKTAFILRELRAYSESHFAREEIVMQACGYPELENHKQVHQMLLQKIEALCVSQQQGKLRTTDFAEFLGSWWEDHVRIMDQAITPHCAGKEDLIASALEEFFITQLAQD
jgi:hemerythrin-like metal-binding protein/PAS domain S-box-containing protein